MKNGGGNDRFWTLRKTNSRFSSVANPLKLARFPHSHRRRGPAKKWKAENRAFRGRTGRRLIWTPNPEKEAGGGGSRPLQAHRSIRKCCGSSMLLIRP